MHRHGDRYVVAEGAIDHLRDLRRALDAGGVAAEIVAPPAAQCSSWGTKLWLAVAGQDVRSALGLIEERWLQGLDERARRSAATTVDLDAARQTCPACLTEFDAGPRRCPTCGLRFG